MTRPLCAGKDPEWWTPEHEQARTAMTICGLCVGCPDNDPKPHGVIRQGIPYFDSGLPMPLCPTCGRPNTGYLGGFVTPCRGCAVPDVVIPDPKAIRASRVRHLFHLNYSDNEIATELGLSVRATKQTRWANKCRRERNYKKTPIEGAHS